MAIILNIETSGNICSVALTKDGGVDFQLEDAEGMKHAERLAPFIEKCMEELRRKGESLDAVAVSIGPGSYTGLRIGLSAAKGLAYSLGIPLIGVDTLKILAVKAMFRSMDWEGDELLVPMLDARRMEVYAAVYDFSLRDVEAPHPVIINSDSWKDLVSEGLKLYLMGPGSGKAKGVINGENVRWIDGLEAHARDMLALSEKAFRENDFLDLAYSVPKYLKEYQATVPKNKVLKVDDNGNAR